MMRTESRAGVLSDIEDLPRNRQLGKNISKERQRTTAYANHVVRRGKKPNFSATVDVASAHEEKDDDDDDD